MPLHRLAEEAEISILYPEQSYIGRFGRRSGLDTRAGADGVAIRLVRPSEDPREAVIHLDHGVLAEILGDLAVGLARRNSLDEAHRAALYDAVGRLRAALRPRTRPS
jgi:hypothetical protein